MLRASGIAPAINPILDFYIDVLEELTANKAIGIDAKILVLAGGQNDRTALRASGFINVVISNLDERMVGTEFAPYRWSYQDAEALDYADDEFDFCIVHSGLHHCKSPHAALLEMYRVARVGILVAEPFDSLTTRLGLKLGLGQTYEHAAVYYNNFEHGGMRNSPVPNFVYRFTAEEIEKTINTAAPYGKHEYQFHYRNRIPWNQLKARSNKLPLMAMKLLAPIVNRLGRRYPQLSNNFAAVVLKPSLPDDLFPWLESNDDQVHARQPWFDARYTPQ